MKRAALIIFGLVWMAFAVGVGILSWPYLVGGGMGDSRLFFQLFGAVTSGSVVFGLLRFIGFVTVFLVSLAVGLGLLLRGFHPPQTR